MTLAEFNAWIEFDKLHPITDSRRIYGPAALIAFSFGGKFDAALEFLHPKPRKASRPLRTVEVIRIPKE